MVIDFKEISDNRGGTLDWRYRRTYTRTFEVLCNSDSDNASTILSYPYVPALFSSFPGDPLCRVKDIRVSQKGQVYDGGLWIVNVQYDSYFEFDPICQHQNPLLRCPLWSFSYAKGERAVMYDLDEDAIVNSAGQPFTPPATVQYVIPQIRIEINKATVDPAVLTALPETCNDATWYGLAAKQVKCDSVEWSYQWENNVPFYKVVYQLSIAPVTIDGELGDWTKTKLLDCGFYERIDGELKIIRDKAGHPVGAPALLKDGRKLNTETEDPVYLDFRLVKAVSFASIP